MSDLPSPDSEQKSGLGCCFWSAVICVAVFVTGSILLPKLIERNPHYYKNVAERCRQHALQKADLKAIRAWMAGLQHPVEDSWFYDPQHIPACISSLQVEDWGGQPWVYHDDTYGMCKITVGWGSGFGHWGIVIGPETMPTPATGPSKYVLPMSPGAYVWHE